MVAIYVMWFCRLQRGGFIRPVIFIKSEVIMENEKENKIEAKTEEGQKPEEKPTESEAVKALKEGYEAQIAKLKEDSAKKEKELTGIIKDLARGDKEAPPEKTELDRVIDEINAFKAHNKYF